MYFVWPPLIHHGLGIPWAIMEKGWQFEARYIASHERPLAGLWAAFIFEVITYITEERKRQHGRSGDATRGIVGTSEAEICLWCWRAQILPSFEK